MDILLLLGHQLVRWRCSGVLHHRGALLGAALNDTCFKLRQGWRFHLQKGKTRLYFPTTNLMNFTPDYVRQCIRAINSSGYHVIFQNPKIIMQFSFRHFLGWFSDTTAAATMVKIKWGGIGEKLKIQIGFEKFQTRDITFIAHCITRWCRSCFASREKDEIKLLVKGWYKIGYGLN